MVVDVYEFEPTDIGRMFTQETYVSQDTYPRRLGEQALVLKVGLFDFLQSHKRNWQEAMDKNLVLPVVVPNDSWTVEIVEKFVLKE